MRFLLFITLFSVVYSCGEDNDESGSEKLDTGDVKGTIQTDGMDVSKNLQLHNNEGEFKAVKIEDKDENEITIYPTKRSLKDIQNDMNQGGFGSKETYEIIKEEDNLLVYELTKKKFQSDEMITGYGFYLIVNGPDKNYLIESKGSDFFEPILDKKNMEALLKIAQSFKPE